MTDEQARELKVGDVVVSAFPLAGEVLRVQEHKGETLRLNHRGGLDVFVRAANGLLVTRQATNLIREEEL